MKTHVGESFRVLGFEIRSNNLTIRETCPLCGENHKEASQPEWIFVKLDDDDYLTICPRCAERYVPFFLEDVEESNKASWEKWEKDELDGLHTVTPDGLLFYEEKPEEIQNESDEDQRV